MSASNFLSTGYAYDALQFEELDFRARTNTRALGMALWKLGFMKDALTRFGAPAVDFIGETAARDLDLDKEDLAALTTDESIEAVVNRHHKLHLMAELIVATAEARPRKAA
jgi:hypothetical protein